LETHLMCIDYEKTFHNIERFYVTFWNLDISQKHC